jgi:hypothetical protein
MDKSNIYFGISIVLFTRLAELEKDCNLTQGCRRFPYLALFPVFDFISHQTPNYFCLHSIERFPAINFSIAEVNIRFIHMQPYLGSIMNLFDDLT